MRTFVIFRKKYARCPHPVADELVSSMQDRSNAHAMRARLQRGDISAAVAAAIAKRITESRDRVLAARADVASYGYGPFKPI